MDINQLTHEQKQDLALNHKANPEDLIALSKPSSDPLDSEIKECLILNPDLPEEAILNIYKSPILDDGFFFNSFMNQDYLPDEVINYFIEAKPEKIKFLLAYKGLSDETIMYIYRKYPNDEYVQAMVASNPSTPQEILIKLLDSSNNTIALNAAMNRSTGESRYITLEMLAEDAPLGYQTKIASDPTMTTDILWILSTVNNVNINTELSKNPNSTPMVFSEIINKDGLRNSVAIANIIVHPNATPEFLIKLSKKLEHPTELTAQAIKKNKDIPLEALLNFLNAGKSGFNVPYSFIQAIKEHPNFDTTDIRVYSSLNGHDQSYVLQNVVLSDSKAKELVRISTQSAMESAAQSVSTPNNVVYALAEVGNASILYILAANRKDETLLETLLYRNSNLADAGLGKNPYTPREIIEVLIDRYTELNTTLYNIAGRKDLPRDLVIKLYNKDPDDTGWLSLLVKNPYCPDSIKEKFRVATIEDKAQELERTGNIPKLDYRSGNGSKIKQKTNTDLELLQRLKGYLNNV